MEHEQVFEMIPAFALGSLGAEDRQQVQAHVDHCAECQAELRAYQSVVAMLPLAVSQREPPAVLKQRIMKSTASPFKSRAVSAHSTRRMFLASLNHLAPAWGMVSLVLIVLLVVSNIWLWQRLDRLESRGKFHVVALAGSESNPNAAGVLVISSDGMEGTLVVEHLAGLEPAFQYQLWLIEDGARTSGGVFSVDADGYAHLQVDSQVPLLSFDAFGVTVEPYGGSPGPTGDKVLGGEL
ncbi:MAG: anti-sigma factor [Anaerolineales bacterium]|nr:anti-sigma factor [Anaerolineales bacterium]